MADSKKPLSKEPPSKEPPSKECPTTDWHRETMRTKYHDPVKLKDTLNKMFGEKNYKVINNRYILMLSRPPRQGEMEKLEKEAREHYNE
ncbi:hypothetical protein CGCA056_v003907 [Colletotrichum aenigma]|uniref:uncharacterized protein n=1 Tax=Colletotrichum aenigma TaxID=1215731 RepID=UPI0018721CE2|nr:uncharacterized protein CGCA056_v003907 [Colletotrichum aenigma]KAF5526678.1 hypothetical protein CGCA056_v003907 [Colletotrichum aenigma]